MPPFVHIDCNNFYASCERVFNPALVGRSVVVLSNNDGCAIARSNEAKALGIKMGEPAFKIKEIVEKHNVAVFSANFELYGDMSSRVMNILGQFSPKQEIYSIDESFLDLEGFDVDFRIYGLEMKSRIEKWTHLPVSIGIGPTKSLAKTATRVAKKFPSQTGGVHHIDTEEKRIKALNWLKVEDVWGIGRRHSKRLQTHGIRTALQFTQLNDVWVKTHMTIVGLRLKQDLMGTPTLELEDSVPKKSIATARTFDQMLSSFMDIRERISTFAVKCAEKLRQQQSCCNAIQIFISSNYFQKELPQHSNSLVIKLPFATNSGIELANYATRALEQIYRPGIQYKKAGVILLDFTPVENQQLTIFENRDTRHIPLMETVDRINRRYNKDIVRLATQAPGRTWRMKQEQLSQRYTTNIQEILKVKTAP